MLNLPRLEQEIQLAFEEVLPPAFERATLEILPEKTKDGDEKAHRFAETIKLLISEDLAKRIANAIDYYIRNANINGTVITVGGPTTQTAVIYSDPVVTNGVIPNTFKII